MGDQVSGQTGDQEALDGALELAGAIIVVESLITVVSRKGWFPEKILSHILMAKIDEDFGRK